MVVVFMCRGCASAIAGVRSIRNQKDGISEAKDEKESWVAKHKFFFSTSSFLLFFFSTWFACDKERSPRNEWQYIGQCFLLCLHLLFFTFFSAFLSSRFFYFSFFFVCYVWALSRWKCAIMGMEQNGASVNVFFFIPFHCG